MTSKISDHFSLKGYLHCAVHYGCEVSLNKLTRHQRDIVRAALKQKPPTHDQKKAIEAQLLYCFNRFPLTQSATSAVSRVLNARPLQQEIQSCLSVKSVSSCRRVSRSWEDLTLYFKQKTRIDYRELLDVKRVIKFTSWERFFQSHLRLQHLDLQAFHVFGPRLEWEDILTQASIYNSSTLRSLVFTCSGYLWRDDNGLSNSLQKLAGLTALTVSCNLSDNALIAALPKLKKLTHLNLTYCVDITDAALTEALPQLTKLTYLNLSSCRWLTDATLTEALPQLTRLEELDLSSCDKNLTEHALIRALGTLTRLKSLTMDHWPASKIRKIALASSIDIHATIWRGRGVGNMDIGVRQIREESKFKYYHTSWLGALRAATLRNRVDQDVKWAFDHLSQADRENIAFLGGRCPGSSLEEGRGKRYSNDIDLWEVVGRVIRFKFDQCSNKNGVFGWVYDLAGRPVTNDPRWGEHHALDDLIRLAEALERVDNNIPL